MLEWLEEYSTGLVEIDDQHKRLFQVFNKLGESIEQGKGEEELEHIMEFLGTYIQDHFGFEEECMEKYKCPSAERNHEAHQKFIEGYESYRDRYHRKHNAKELIEDIHQECEKWFKNHICQIDVHLRECVHRQQSAE